MSKTATLLSSLALMSLIVVNQVQAQTQLGDLWRLRSPSPTGEPLSSIVIISSSAALAVGNGTTVLSSTLTSGSTWTGSRAQPSIAIGTPSRAAYSSAAGKVLMVAGTSFLQSTNAGSLWTPITTDLPDFDSAIALNAASGEFLLLLRAYDQNGPVTRFATSSDGLAWTVRGTVPGNQVSTNQITRNPAGRYVIVGQSYDEANTAWKATIWSTTDGTTWSTTYGTTSEVFTDVLWTGSNFVAIQTGSSFSSPDGITWTAGGTLNSPICLAKSSSSSTLLALGKSLVFTSTDEGTTWTQQTAPSAPPLPLAVAHNGSSWMAVGENGMIYTSTNTTSWLRRTPSGQIGNFRSIAHNNLSGTSSIYIAMDDDKYAWTSSNGTNWSRISLPTFPDASSILWDGTQFVITGNFFATTTDDASSWTSSGQFGPSNQTPDIMVNSAFAGGKYVTVGYADGTNAPVIYSGTAYNAFTKRTTPAGSGALKAVTKGGSTWIIVGDSGTILTSTNGDTWTKRSAGADAAFYNFGCVASSGSVIIAAGDQSATNYYTSTNGTTWVLRDNQPFQFTSVVWTGTQFVAIDAITSSAQTSPDGVNWTRAPLPTSQTIHSLTLTSTELLGAGDNNTFISSDLVPEINFALTSQSVYETDGTATVLITLSSPATAQLDVPLTVHSSSTAVLNTDYSALPGTVTFLPGQLAKVVDVPLLDDASVESTKILRLVAGAVTGARLGNNAMHTLNILDNDSPPTVAFVKTAVSAAENVGSIALEIELSAPASGTVTVNLTPGGSASPTNDYSAPATVSFSMGERRKTVVVSIIDDADVEGTETASFTLASPSGATLASSNTACTLTIYDNDPASSSWTLRQPKPTAAGLNAITSTSSGFVVVGDGGTILTSPDGIAWTQRNTGRREIRLFDVNYAASKIIAVGDKGHVQTSVDGIAWTDTIVPGLQGNSYLWGVASSGSRHVVVGSTNAGNGDAPLIYSSADGIYWTAESLPISKGSLYGIAWNGSTFAAVGNRSLSDGTYKTVILVSSDGRAWTDKSDQLTGIALGRVKAVGTSFVALDGSKDCYVGNATGGLWQKRTAGTKGTINSCASTGSKTIGVGDVITSSLDLATFTQITSPTKTKLADVIYAFGQLVAIGGTSTIYTSPDGSAWTQRSRGFDKSAEFSAATWTGTQFIAVGENLDGLAPTLIATSPDGITWTERPNTLGKNLRSIAWNGTTAIAVGNGGAILSSANGIAWAPKNSGTTMNLSSVIWVRNQFVAVGGQFSLSYPTTITGGAIVLTSPDGNTWTRRTVPTNHPLDSIAYSGSLYVAVGRSISDSDYSGKGVILTSPDAVTWTSRTGGLTDIDFTSVAADGSGNLVAATSDFGILRSSDGLSWTAATVPSAPGTESSIHSVFWTGTQFLAGTSDGYVLYSSTGATWTLASTDLSGGGITGFASNSQTIIAVGTNASVQTSGIGGSLPIPKANFALASSSVSESSGIANLLVTLSSPPATKVTITIGTQNLSSGMAITGATADLTVPSAALVFNPGETERYLLITIKNDKIIEAAESLDITLSTVTGGATLGTTQVTHTLTINDDDSLPVVTLSPSALYTIGSPITLIATATGAPPLSYQWKKNGVALPATAIGSKSPTLFIYQAALADGGDYTCTVTNGNGNGLSNTSLPTRIVVYENQSAAFNYDVPTSFTAKFTQPVSSNAVLHWFKGMTEITTALPAGITLSANRATLSVTNPSANQGTYICRIELPGVNSSTPADGNTYILTTSGSGPGVNATTLPDGTVGTFYSQTITTLGIAESWTASGLPAGLSISRTGVISGFPEAANTTPKSITITAKNGNNTSVIKPTLVIKAMPAGLAGSHLGLIARDPSGNNNLGGIITLTVAPNGYFTGAYTIGIAKASLTGRVHRTPGTDNIWLARNVSNTGNPTSVINGQVIELSFGFDETVSEPKGSGALLVTALGGSTSTAPFTTVLPLTGSTLANYIGRHTFVLKASTSTNFVPKGHGFGSATLASSGAVTFAGKTADGSVFTASSPLNVLGGSLLYSALYNGNGSLMAKPTFTLGGSVPAYADSTVVDVNASWFKLPDSSVAALRNYPAGWAPLTIELKGSRFITPTTPATTVPMGLSYTPGLNNADISFGIPSEAVSPGYIVDPDISVNIKPGGSIEQLFFNPGKVTLTVKPADGSFSGTINMSTILQNNVPLARAGLKYEGQIVRIIGHTPETAGYGFLSLPSVPDINISPVPAATSTPIITTPVELKPITTP